MTRSIISIGILILMGAIFAPQQLDARCGCGDGIRVYVDYWDLDDCSYCCWEYEWWLVPYWYWRPCWWRLVRIYYSPCGWYQYVYYDYPCSGCNYAYVRGRWVWRSAVRLERRYSYGDMAQDFVRRRGLSSAAVYRTSTSRSSSTTRYRDSSGSEYSRVRETSAAEERYSENSVAYPIVRSGIDSDREIIAPSTTRSPEAKSERINTRGETEAVSTSVVRDRSDSDVRNPSAAETSESVPRDYEPSYKSTSTRSSSESGSSEYSVPSSRSTSSGKSSSTTSSSSSSRTSNTSRSSSRTKSSTSRSTGRSGGGSSSNSRSGSTRTRSK